MSLYFIPSEEYINDDYATGSFSFTAIHAKMLQILMGLLFL